MARVCGKNKTCVHGFPNGVNYEGHWHRRGYEQAGQLIAEHFCKKFTAEFSDATKNNPKVK